MHIPEGVLSPTVLGAGALLSAAGVAAGLRAIDFERVPRVAVVSSVFFVASLIHVPLGPSSVHLVLNGLAGVILGWSAFPALLVGLLLQAVFFGYGGITVLGVNTFNMAFPAVVCHYVFGGGLRKRGRTAVFGLGFAAGALGVALGALMVGLSLLASGGEFLAAAGLLISAHVPVIVVEGFVTGSVVTFLHKARPEVLAQPGGASTCKEAAHV